MTLFDEYQVQAASFAITDLNIAYAALGLNGEAGEVAEHAKKCIRDDGGVLTEERIEKLGKELGDVLWYLAACATAAGLSLGDIATTNIDKLTSRQERGVLSGSGSDR